MSEVQNKYAGAALIIHIIFSAFALISAIVGLIVMKGSGKYEAFQILEVLALTAWFIVFPLAAISVMLSLFSLGTIALLILALSCLMGVTNNFSNDAQNAALTLAYPCGTIADGNKTDPFKKKDTNDLASLCVLQDSKCAEYGWSAQIHPLKFINAAFDPTLLVEDWKECGARQSAGNIDYFCDYSGGMRNSKNGSLIGAACWGTQRAICN